MGIAHISLQPKDQIQNSLAIRTEIQFPFWRVPKNQTCSYSSAKILSF